MKLVEFSVEFEVKELVVIDCYKIVFFFFISYNQRDILMAIIGPMSNNTPGPPNA